MDIKALLAQIALIVLGSNKKTAPLVPFVVQGMQEAEDTAAKAKAEGRKVTGAEKLQIAKSFTHIGATAINVVKPGTVDADAVDTALASGISTIVSVVNLIQKHQAAPVN